MVEVSLLEFARSGRFGPVELGMRRERVHELLGLPDDWSATANSDRTARIWKYGTTEFHFADGELWLIHSDEFEVPEGGSRIHLEPWVLRRGLALAAFEAALGNQGVAHVVQADLVGDGAAVVRTAAGARFSFAPVEGQREPGLRAFSSATRDGVGP